jgi:hypothetical protein
VSERRVIVRHGDALDALGWLADEFVDAVVTDPPYELGFMGRAWDASGIAYNVDLWKQCLRVLKPGGHLLAFGGTRTSHRLTCAIEDAGFEIRDEIAWLYGSGFPKSLDVSKAIDKAAGAEREVIGERSYGDGHIQRSKAPRFNGDAYAGGNVYSESEVRPLTAPATDDAKRWAGWGTALKPAHEPIVVARKPLVGTVAANVLAYGTGAFNIDACRVVSERGRPLVVSNRRSGNDVYGDGLQGSLAIAGGTDLGRWPTNVVLDEAAAAELDEQSGMRRPGERPAKRAGMGFDDGEKNRSGTSGEREVLDTGGGASRFFPVFRYQAKAPARERPKVEGVAHPTVKPLELMRWLVRLVTPIDGIVLDPFAGSGTTLEAAVAEGMRCIGIEQSADYLPLIDARMMRAGLVVVA